MLIIRVGLINFKLVQPICSWYINVMDGWTDRRTDWRLTIAIQRFALHASRGKNDSLIHYCYQQIGHTCYRIMGNSQPLDQKNHFWQFGCCGYNTFACHRYASTYALWEITLAFQHVKGVWITDVTWPWKLGRRKHLPYAIAYLLPWHWRF